MVQIRFSIEFQRDFEFLTKLFHSIWIVVNTGLNFNRQLRQITLRLHFLATTPFCVAFLLFHYYFIMKKRIARARQHIVLGSRGWITSEKELNKFLKIHLYVCLFSNKIVPMCSLLKSHIVMEFLMIPVFIFWCRVV